MKKGIRSAEPTPLWRDPWRPSWDEQESDDGDERPCPERLDDSSVVHRGKYSVRDPLYQGEYGEDTELHLAHQATVSCESRPWQRRVLGHVKVDVDLVNLNIVWRTPSR